MWRQGPFQRVMAASDSMDDLEHEIAESAESLDSLLQAVEEIEPKPTPRSQQRLSSRLAIGVAGRKWEQAEAFADVLSIGGPIVDWCSGKGHLARVLCHRGCFSSAHCLELDEALCASGEALSTDLPIDFTVTDALGADPLPPRLRGSAYAHTALHACGDLHRRALTTACREQARRIALVPCCYHKVGPEVFSPLSRRVAAESALLPLRTAELQLATAQTAAASTAARAREQRWRLAIDAWQREARGEDAYLSAPSAPVRLLRSDAGFAEFCEFFGSAPGRSAAERGALAGALRRMADDATASRHFLELGEAARRRVRRLEEVRRQYSRPLELWLCADMMLHLGEEGGYDVELRRLCEPEVTPRNLMVVARRREGVNDL